MTWLLIALFVIAVVVVLLVAGVVVAEFTTGPVEDTTEGQPAAPAGRHRHDTVEIVPASYMPLVGRRRIAALTDTQRMELPE